jgi:hypothetical protein
MPRWVKPQGHSWLAVLPLLSSVTVALGFFSMGALRPLYNWDVIPYAALAKEVRGAGGQAEAYEDLRAAASLTQFEPLVYGPFRDRAYRSASFFTAILPFYKIKPFYVLLSSAIGALLGSDVEGAHVVAAISAMFAVLFSYMMARYLLDPPARIVVAAAWLVFGGAILARLATPDALAALLCLVLAHVYLSRPARLLYGILLTVVAMLLVATRTDYIIFVATLVVADVALVGRDRLSALISLAAACITVAIINHFSGNYGWAALVNFTFINGWDSLIVVDNNLPLVKYVHFLFYRFHYLFDSSDGNYNGDGGLFLIICLILIVLAWHYTKFDKSNIMYLRCRSLVLALLLFLLAHFAMFPDPWQRFFIAPYVLSTMLLASRIRFACRP